MTLNELRKNVKDLQPELGKELCEKITHEINAYEKDLRKGIYEEMNTGANAMQEDVDYFIKRIRL